MRQPVFGDFENGRDNYVMKDIDIMDEDGEWMAPPLIATEWFAELCYAGFWRVNPAWLEANTPPDPEPPVDEPETTTP
jgi:hypothetical protein